MKKTNNICFRNLQVVLPFPLEALAVRIIPTAWHEGIAIRVDLIGCYRETVTSTETTTTSGMVTTTSKPIVRNAQPCEKDRNCKHDIILGNVHYYFDWEDNLNPPRRNNYEPGDFPINHCSNSKDHLI